QRAVTRRDSVAGHRRLHRRACGGTGWITRCTGLPRCCTSNRCGQRPGGWRQPPSWAPLYLSQYLFGSTERCGRLPPSAEETGLLQQAPEGHDLADVVPAVAVCEHQGAGDRGIQSAAIHGARQVAVGRLEQLLLASGEVLAHLRQRREGAFARGAVLKEVLILFRERELGPRQLMDHTGFTDC